MNKFNVLLLTVCTLATINITQTTVVSAIRLRGTFNGIKKNVVLLGDLHAEIGQLDTRKSTDAFLDEQIRTIIEHVKKSRSLALVENPVRTINLLTGAQCGPNEVLDKIFDKLKEDGFAVKDIECRPWLAELRLIGLHLKPATKIFKLFTELEEKVRKLNDGPLANRLYAEELKKVEPGILINLVDWTLGLMGSTRATQAQTILRAGFNPHKFLNKFAEEEKNGCPKSTYFADGLQSFVLSQLALKTLFDLNALHEILSAPDSNIIVITGAAHAEALSKYFTRLGFKVDDNCIINIKDVVDIRRLAIIGFCIDYPDLLPLVWPGIPAERLSAFLDGRPAPSLVSRSLSFMAAAVSIALKHVPITPFGGY